MNAHIGDPAFPPDYHTAKVHIRFVKGIHMRPASKIVQLAQRFQAQITLQCEQRQAKAHSMTQLLLLEATHGQTIHIFAQGPDAQHAVKTLVSFLKSSS
ncbi:MAG: HPr family phosphocarrier protein [Myxococcota bacterium]